MTKIERIIQGLMILQEANPDAEIRWDTNGIHVYVNVSLYYIKYGARLRQLGWQRDEFVEGIWSFS